MGNLRDFMKEFISMKFLWEASANAMASPGGKPGQQGSIIEAILPFVIIIAVFYLMVFMPQRKERKKREEMLKNVKTGDKIITTSGIYGEIVKVENDHIMVKVSDNNTKLKMLKSAVSVIENAQPTPPTVK